MNSFSSINDIACVNLFKEIFYSSNIKIFVTDITKSIAFYENDCAWQLEDTEKSHTE